MASHVSGTVICDLDGVVYLGDESVPGAGNALDRVEGLGFSLVFCTNNSSRTREQSAGKIRRVTGYAAVAAQIASSAMAAGSLVDAERVLVVGGDGIVEAVEASGATVVEDGPVDVVVVGIDWRFTYDRLDRAAAAVRSGARFIATNRDATFPAPDGLRPGAGSIVAAIEMASGVRAVTAGKPEVPMRRLLEGMVDGAPIVMIGDRPDTDLAIAQVEGWISVLVETGVTPAGASVDPAPDQVLGSITELPAFLARTLETTS